MNSKIFIINRSAILAVILLFTFFTFSCKKFVEIPPPTTALVSSTVFNNAADATAAQTVIYSQMANNGESFSISQVCGLSADELTNYSTNNAVLLPYTNSMTATPLSFGRWSAAYFYIYQANAVIAGMQNNTHIAPAIVRQLNGESKFIRAFWHFYLTNTFGAVPLVLSTDYAVTSKLSRTSQAIVYQQVIADLKEAYTQLNSNYVDASDTTSTTERVRPNKAAAAALLARAYLYTKDYVNAESQASLVINNSQYSLCTNLSPQMGPQSVFLTNSSEAIWQLQTPLPATMNTVDGSGYILQGGPNTISGGTQSSSISPQLSTAFEPGDLRAKYWIGTTNTNPAYAYPYKYQSYNVSSPITEYVMVLRLAEQYLIRAEARDMQGNMSGALADLNIIRKRAGLQNYAGATDQASLLAAILHERQVELFTEWGHRWFDLKRTGNLDAVMGPPGNVFLFKNGSGTWNSDWALYPIPQSEILKDINLQQNPGY